MTTKTYKPFSNDELIILASALHDGSFIYPKDSRISNKLSREIKTELKNRNIVLSKQPSRHGVEQ